MKNEKNAQIKVTPGTIILMLLLVPLLLVPAIAMIVAFQKISSPTQNPNKKVLTNNLRSSATSDSTLRASAEMAAEHILPVPKPFGQEGSVLIETPQSQFESIIEKVRSNLLSDHLQFIEHSDGSSERFVIAGHLDHQQSIELKNKLYMINRGDISVLKIADSSTITGLSTQHPGMDESAEGDLFIISIRISNN